MSQDDARIEELVGSYERGRLSRREFFKRASALGLAAPAITGLLAHAAAAGRRPDAAALAAAGPRRGGTLIEGYDRLFSPITTINAAWIDPTHDALLESLVTVDPAGNLVPKLAESWTVSKDAKTWTFKLRRGVRFHSGALVTAGKVAEDLNEDRGKLGQHPFWYTQVVSIKPGPRNTVVVRCNKPFATLGFLYKQQFANIFNNAAVKADPKGYGTKVVDGTGPFRLTSFSPQQVTAKRFEQYAGSIVPYFQNKGKAYLSGIKWVPIAEASNRANEIVSGNVHIIKNPLPTDLPALKANKNLVVIEKEEAAGLVLGLNFTKTNLGFDDLRVRQAVSHAIDRDAIVRAILFGHGTAVRGPFPKTYKWYEKGVEKFNQFDTNKANQLLDSAGWTKGSGGVRTKGGQKLEFTIINFTDEVRNKVGDAIVAMLGKVGISAKMQNLEAGAYFQGLGSGAEAYFFNWLWLDFPRIYQVLADSRFIPAPNWAHAKVPAVDKAMDGWTFAQNAKQEEAAARKIQLAVAENVPVITIYVPHVVWVHTKKLHGYQPLNPNTLYPFYNDMWLEA
jgi:peptide/nickel transport system substrate-binding protein